MQPAAVGQQWDTVKPVETGKFILLRLQADCIDSEKVGKHETLSSLVRIGRRGEVIHANKKSMEEMRPKGRSRIQAGNCEEHMR